jgi:hypothetical protein
LLALPMDRARRLRKVSLEVKVNLAIPVQTGAASRRDRLPT